MAHLVRMVVVAYVMFLTVKLCIFDTWMSHERRYASGCPVRRPLPGGALSMEQE
jgi:hypothetical protein